MSELEEMDNDTLLNEFDTAARLYQRRATRLGDSNPDTRLVLSNRNTVGAELLRRLSAGKAAVEVAPEKPWYIDSTPTDSVGEGGHVCTYLATIKPHDLADAFTAEISWVNGGWHYDPDANDDALTCVIAWRHMPEPYKPEGAA